MIQVLLYQWDLIYGTVCWGEWAALGYTGLLCSCHCLCFTFLQSSASLRAKYVIKLMKIKGHQTNKHSKCTPV